MTVKTTQAPGREDVHTWEVRTPSGPATLTLAQKGRTFTVTDFTVKSNPDLSLAFEPKGAGVENLDETSDAAQCFNVSLKVRVDGITLTPSEMRANSPEELRAALSKVGLVGIDWEAI